MKFNAIQSCHIGPEISPEQFIPEHFFLFLLKGSMIAYDGHRNYRMEEGDYYIARKNHLIRYTKNKREGQFEKIIITFDETFLKKFLEKHYYSAGVTNRDESFVFLQEEPLIRNFVQSLEPYYNGGDQLDKVFADLKREELLLIILKSNQELADVFFNFGAPEKIDLESFMNKNFRFNVSLERFAFLTGRSLSSFKRDFQSIFNSTPGQWLTRKRLDEAYFKIKNESQKPGDIYLDLGFEDLSHFSYAFKKQFGQSPTNL